MLLDGVQGSGVPVGGFVELELRIVELCLKALVL
jgi:hypothetical protein